MGTQEHFLERWDQRRVPPLPSVSQGRRQQGRTGTELVEQEERPGGPGSLLSPWMLLVVLKAEPSGPLPPRPPFPAGLGVRRTGPSQDV